MQTIEIKDGKFKDGRLYLSDKQKKAIDIYVNGSFMVLGLSLVLGSSFTGVNADQTVGLLAIYMGVRFFPR